MAFGNEIKFKIGAESANIERTFDRVARKAGEAGAKIDRAMRGGGSSAARDKVFLQIQRERVRRLEQEGTTVQKISHVMKELRGYAVERSMHEKGTVQYLKAQLAIEERITRLRQLQRQQQAEGQGALPTPAQESQRGGGIGLGGMALRAIGGAITFALERAIAYQASRVRVDEAKGQAAGAASESIRTRGEAVLGLEGQRIAAQGRARDVRNQRDFAQNRVNFLSEGIQGAVSRIAPEELEKAETELASLNAQFQEASDQVTIITRNIEKAKLGLDAERSAVEAVNRARNRGLLTQARQLEIEINQTRMLELAEQLYGTPEGVQAQRTRRIQQEGELQGARMQAGQRRRDLNQTFTEEVSHGRTFANGRPRPRTEAERLADRAAQFRQRSRDAVLLGNRKDAGRFIQAARGDERNVADRIASGSSGIPQANVADPGSLKPELVNANAILKSIDNSLRNSSIGINVTKGFGR